MIPRERYFGGGFVKRNRTIASLALALVSLTPLVMSQESRVMREGGNWVEEVSGSLSAAKVVRIKAEPGAVRVLGDSQSGISYSVRSQAFTSDEKNARRQFEMYKISAAVRGETVWITGEWQGGRPRKFSSEFTIHVPRNTEWVKVETDGGSVSATGLAGRLDSESGGGTIHLDDIGGPVNAETGGGTIEVGNVGGDLVVRTGGGSIHVGSAKGKVVAETGGGSVTVASGLQGVVIETGAGSVQLKKCVGKAKVSSGGGSVELGDINGPVEVETGAGSIRVAWATGMVHAETGGGSVELSGVSSAHVETGGGAIVAKFVDSNRDRPESLLETPVGDVVVYLIQDVPMTVRAVLEVANGHTITSDFAELRVSSEGGEWGPRIQTAEGKLNGGGPTLKVRTTTGDVMFHRAQR